MYYWTNYSCTTPDKGWNSLTLFMYHWTNYSSTTPDKGWNSLTLFMYHWTNYSCTTPDKGWNSDSIHVLWMNYSYTIHTPQQTMGGTLLVFIQATKNWSHLITGLD